MNFFRSLIFFLTACTVLLSSCEKKKADIIAKDWKAAELELAGTKLAGDQISLSYSFSPDGTFKKTEDGRTESGKWSITLDGQKLILTYASANSTVEKNIDELTEEKLTISGEEHGMMRREVYHPNAK